jgi:circadian clock protein KaiC
MKKRVPQKKRIVPSHHPKAKSHRKRNNPTKFSKRISTGIKNFDSLIEKGFEKNSTNLIVGGPGSGKTIFATQFIYDGLKKGEPCLFITFEEGKNSFFHNMKKIGVDLENYEKSGLFTFLNHTPAKVKTMLEEGGGTIESVVIKKEIKRMVIDSMTSFTLLFKDELKKREASLELFNILKKWNCTTILTFEAPIGEDKRVYKTLEFESDSIILMQFIRKLIRRERFIEVLKMRGTNHSKNLYKFEIGKSGIVINNRPVTGKKIR